MRLYVISAIIDQVLFSKSYYFSKYERIVNIRIFIFTKRSYWMPIVIYAYSCMLHIAYVCAFTLVVCYQYKTFVSIDIIGLNNILSNLKVTKVSVYFNNRHVAKLSLVVKYSSITNNYRKQNWIWINHAHNQALIVLRTKISHYDFASGLGQSGQANQKLKNTNVKNTCYFSV